MSQDSGEFTIDDFGKAYRLIISGCYVVGEVLAPGAFEEMVQRTLSKIVSQDDLPESERVAVQRVLPLAEALWQEYFSN